MKNTLSVSWAIARNSFREVIRERLLYGIILMAALLTSASFFLSTISLGQDHRVLQNVGLASIHLFTLFITVFVATNAVAKDFERKALYFLFPKPVSRAQYVIGKYIGMLLLLLTTLAILGGLFTLGAYFVDRTTLEAAAINIGYGFMEISLLLSLAHMFASFTAPLNAALYTVALFIIGHSQTSLKAYVAELGQPVLKSIVNAVYYIFPNLEKFDVRGATLYQVAIPGEQFLWALFYWILFTGIGLALATSIMKKQEF